jgi:hypothetical protein
VRLRREGRLLDETAWEKCTLFDVNFSPRQMSVAELENGLVDLARRLYTDEMKARRMATRVQAPTTSGLERFRKLFLIAALYDCILGLAFFFLHRPIFVAFGIPLLNNTSYIHLTAGFVFVQGVAYWFVHRNMLRNIDIVRMGVLYKAIYSAVAVYYLVIGELPHAIFAWFAVFDVLFLVWFVAFLREVAPSTAPRPRALRS